MFVFLLNVSVHFDANQSCFQALQVAVYHLKLLCYINRGLNQWGQRVCIGNTRNAYEILVGKSKKKKKFLNVNKA
jgi:hypothetical protein